MKKKLLALFLALFLLPCWAALAQGETTPAVTDEPEAMPNFFSMIDAVDIYGEPFDASVFTRGVTLVNVWATWCGPCVREIPALSALAAEYEGKLAFVGICHDAVDNKGKPDEDGIEGAKALWDTNQVGYPALVPDAMALGIIDAMGLQYFPTTWFVDQDGYILYEATGAYSQDDWRALIDQVLAYVEQNAGA